MLEILVAISCIYQAGCSETSASYYQTSAQLQETMRYSEARLKHHLGERALAGVSTVALLATGNEWHAELYKGLTLKGQKWGSYSLLYTYRF